MPAANGVDFLEPLNPVLPVDAHVIVLPSRSVMVTIVLLKVASIRAMPLVTTRAAFLTFFGLLFFCSTVFHSPFYFLSYYADRLPGAFPGPGIRLRPLPPDRQAAPVPQASVTSHVDEPLDVRL